MSLSRRQFAQLLAAGALSTALPGTRNAEDAARAARALDEPARLDGEVLGYFRRALDEYYRADKMLGPGGCSARSWPRSTCSMTCAVAPARRTPTRCCASWPATARWPAGCCKTAATWTPPRTGPARPGNGRNARAM